jgi:hypothetical protein
MNEHMAHRDQLSWSEIQMNNLANEVLKYYFDLYCNPDGIYSDEVYVVEEIERLSIDLKEKYTSEEQKSISSAASDWLNYFHHNTDTHIYTRKTSWSTYDVDFLEFMASGDFCEQEIYWSPDLDE